MIALIVLVIILALAVPLSIFTVNQQTAAVIERFGKFKKIANAGLNFKIPLIDRVAGKLSLRVQQLDVKVETKTEDNVFLFVVVSVQYLVLPEKIVDAFYKLQNAQAQITSYVFDTVRAQVPSIKLDDVFVAKDDIAQAVKKELDHVMDDPPCCCCRAGRSR
jgi:regulator of protease activity HflC (stomatin/prohibitin superfamily)